MVSAPASAPSFATHLQEGEFILRGGCLEKPLLLTAQDFVSKGGVQFCKLDCKLNAFLALYLSGVPWTKRPLAHSQLQPMLSRFRDEKLRELSNPAAVMQDDGVPPLALETESEASSPVPGDQKRPSQSRRAVLQKHALFARTPFVVVDLQVGDQQFPLRLMVDVARANPSFEVSSVNFQRLFDWFRLETPGRLQRELEAASAPKPERQARTDRVYYRKDKKVFFRRFPSDVLADLVEASAFETPQKRKRRPRTFTTRVEESSRKKTGRPRNPP